MQKFQRLVRFVELGTVSRKTAKVQRFHGGHRSRSVFKQRLETLVHDFRFDGKFAKIDRGSESCSRPVSAELTFDRCQFDFT